MAIKLTQGADSTIVTAATRAGLATSPKDYSDTFQNVADSYAKSTQASAEAWGQIAGTIAVVGAELQKNAEVYSDTAQRVYNAGGTEELVDELYNIKDELSALGTFGGKFGDRETRRKRSEILARRNKLFAEIDGWGNSLEEASLASKNGLLDENLMGPNGVDSEFVNAIIASNTPNKKTGNANEARISRDPKTGELIYTLHDMDSGGAAIPGKTMSLSTFKTIIQDSAKDVDNVTGTFLSGTIDGAENYGATYGGTMNEYHKNKLLDSLDPMTSNAATLRRGMRTRFSGTSFYDELTGPNQTELSSKYFTLMLQDIANVKDGEIKADALGDVKDTDGSGGISQQEINDQYVLFQNSILTGEGPMAKKLFTDFVMNKAETAYNFGARQKAKGTPSETGNDDGLTPWRDWGASFESQYLPTGGTDFQKPVNVLWTVKRDRRNALDNLDVVRGSHGVYTHKEGITWTYDGEDYTTYEIASIEGLIKDGESRTTFNVANREQDIQDQGNIEKGQATLTMLKAKGDDGVSGQLNQTFKMSMIAGNPTEYFFAPFSTDYKRGTYDPATSDRAASNDVMLVNTRGPNGKLLNKNSFKPVINPATGQPYRFKTGSEATENDLETINKLMLQMGFIKKQTELPG